MQFPLKVGIGAKLGLSIGVGVLLVGLMLAREHFSSRYVADLVAAADQQQAILHESAVTRVMLQNAQIAGRDIRQAQTADEVNAQLARLQTVADQARDRLSALDALALSDKARAQFGRINELTLSYIAALRAIGAKQNDILSLFKQLDEAEANWTRSFNQLVNSDSFSLLPNVSIIETLVNEAGSAFKDARTATWRYFVLSERSQVARITGAADQAIEKLGYARRDLNDPKVIQSIDNLRAAVPAYMAVLKAISAAINGQNEIQKNQGSTAEVAARQVLDEVAATAAQLSDQATSEAVAGTAQTERLRFAAGGIVTMLFLGIALFAARTIGRPIHRIGGVLMDLAKGNTAVHIPYVARGDEIGDTARAASVFKDSLLRMAEIEAQQTAAENRTRAERKSEMNRLADTFEHTIGEIVNSVSATSSQLEGSASTLTNAADSTKQLAGLVVSAAEQTSSNVKAVSSATEEISASTVEISRQSRASSDLAQEAVRQAETANARMMELVNAAAQIDAVVNLISAIAGQTNLLALNATIEAARAGESGRGFAVVASEVKTLAKQTTNATEEISSHIAGIQNASRDSVGALKEIRSTIDRLAEIAAAVAVAVDEQDATTHDISRSVKEVSQGTSQVAQSILQVNKGVAETESASGNVLISARTLAGESSKLKAEAQNFLATVRAAS